MNCCFLITKLDKFIKLSLSEAYLLKNSLDDVKVNKTNMILKKTGKTAVILLLHSKHSPSVGFQTNPGRTPSAHTSNILLDF